MATKPKYLVCKPINYSARIALQYQLALHDLIDKMAEKAEREILKLAKGNAAKQHFTGDASISSAYRILFSTLLKDFDVMFSSKAKDIAGSLWGDTEKWTTKELNRSLSELASLISFKTDTTSKSLDNIRKAAIHKNVDLIKTIPQQYLGAVKQNIYTSITTGKGLSDIQPFLESQKDYSKRKAQLVALDQTRKITTDIAAHKLKQNGGKKFKWMHTGGSQHPRQEHIAMNGNIYSYDDPPVIDPRTGETGLPAQAYQCRCRLCPVLEWLPNNNTTKNK